MKNCLLSVIFSPCLSYFLKNTYALGKFDPTIQGKHPMHGKKGPKMR